MPHGHKLYRVAVNYTNIFRSKAFRNITKLDFWHENRPSGNPGQGYKSGRDIGWKIGALQQTTTKRGCNITQTPLSKRTDIGKSVRETKRGATIFRRLPNVKMPTSKMSRYRLTILPNREDYLTSAAGCQAEPILFGLYWAKELVFVEVRVG
jgi:hypothetical protein